MIHGQKMEKSLGLPIWIEGFKDGQPRKAYPITLEYLMDANICLSSFDNNDLYKNFKDENSTMCMAKLFSIVFKVDGDELYALLQNIDDTNFSEIISDIKTISGIVDKQEDTKPQGDSKPIDWDVSINAIPLYTSTPIDKVKDMTLIQFNKTLELIAKKINYEYKSNTIGLVKEPDRYISESDYPLYSEQVVSETRLTLKDIAGFMQ